MKEYLNMDKNFIVSETNRLDKFLASNIDASRNQIEQLIKKEYVKVDGKIISKTGLKLKENQSVDVHFPEVELNPIKDEIFVKESLKDKNVEIIYEDNDILVINKPCNLTVHDAPSVKDATLVDWLKLNNISLSTLSGEERHGIVHRLDKGTSGVMVVAKTNEAHIGLSKQLEEKSMGRYYLAIIDTPLKDNIMINKPIGRNQNNRLKMSIEENGRNAKSAFCKVALSNKENFELIVAKLYTGRTHQIRVHLKSEGHFIVGDDLYGDGNKIEGVERQFLHAYKIKFTHPVSNEEISLEIPIYEDMKKFLED